MDEVFSVGDEGRKLVSSEQAQERIEKNLAELARRREAGEIDEKDYDLEELVYYQGLGTPLDRKDLGNRAVVIAQKDLEKLGGLKIVLPDGKTTIIDPEVTGYGPGDKLVIFPEDLG